MRIFQVIESSANTTIQGGKTWCRNLYEPLIDIGHDVILFRAERGRDAMRREDSRACAVFSEELLQACRRAHREQGVDLLFSYLMDGMVEPLAIDEIRKLGIPTCNFSCNNVHQFYLVDELSPHFDYCLHAERDVGPRFREIGANPVWWPMASNPKYFHPYDVPRTLEASFVGANYALRAQYVAHLLEHGVGVHVYGPGWQRAPGSRWRSVARHYRLALQALAATGPVAWSRASSVLAQHDCWLALQRRFPGNLHLPVSDEELVRLYSCSHISLGFLDVHDQHDPSRPVTQHLHLREFEAPMCGALYCTGYMDELAEFFEPEKEVVVYRNRHELLDKVRYYLSHPGEAQRVRQAGRVRALRDHTYQERFRSLFAQLGLED